jgi:hypothetical protein
MATACRYQAGPQLSSRAGRKRPTSSWSFDWVDLAGNLKPLGGPPAGKVIQISLDHQLHNGWSMDYQALPPVDLFISADPDTATAALVQAIGPGARTAPAGPARPLHEPKPGRALGIEDLAHALRGAVGKRDVSLTHLPLSWQTSFWHFRHPLDFLGSDGGGGVGGGPGISVGAALALKGSGRLPIASRATAPATPAVRWRARVGGPLRRNAKTQP